MNSYTECVTAVVSLYQNFELRWCANGEHWRRFEVEFLQLPTEDIFSAPDMAKLHKGVQFVLEHLRQRGTLCTVYVHCKVGRTRSATLVGCYLIERYSYTPNECIKVMQAARKQMLFEELQLVALQEYYKNYMKLAKTTSAHC
ncbi:protein-tyrosine phosphatase mitochondrial 1 protein-like [Tropilaelaps mercedesae]|uniref:Protein-tyrosine phosphatase mitochondrial 1 protein-like n=1 Tax=Tropilaelaps mercedesae TaxID=418985 RepID=A0A1V9XQD5_9ACAR|nr:protein-tyrosine phosphatase mitochondrial 1 protein-like [Tropilaelaps mercedesae]